MVESKILDKVRQLTIQIHFNVNSTVEECRENIKTIRSIEERGFKRFSSKIDAFSYSRHNEMGIDDYMSYDLTWVNQYLQMPL